MFLRVEGDQLINLSLMSRIEIIHRHKAIRFWNAGVLEVESSIAYGFFLDPANEDLLFVKVGKEA